MPLALSPPRHGLGVAREASSGAALGAPIDRTGATGKAHNDDSTTIQMTKTPLNETASAQAAAS